MSTGTELQPKQDEARFPVYAGESLARNKLAFLVDRKAFEHLWAVASGYSRSALVPRAFQGKKDDCFIACQLAVRLNVDPFMLMQSMYVVHGRPGFEAKLAIALLNSSGKIKGTLKTTFGGTGDDYGARAWCIDADTGERVDGPKVDWKMVKAEGWNKDKQLRDGGGVQKSKWNTMPDVMFTYRAASFLIRTNYPEVLMGMQTVEELEDTIHTVGEVQLSNQSRVELLLSGESDAPESGIEVRSEPEPEQTAPEPPESDRPQEQPEHPYAGEEAAVVAQWKDDLASVSSLEELSKAKGMIPENLSTDAKKAIVDAIEMRGAALRGDRAKRSQKTMV